MTFIHRLFSGDDELAKEIVADEEIFQKNLDTYLASVPKKQEAAERYEHDANAALLTLSVALATELALIKENEKSEEEIIDDLLSLKHRMDRKDLRGLNLSMNHARTQERFVYYLMDQLRQLLLDQAHTVSALKNNRINRGLLKRLRDQLDLERLMVGKMECLGKNNLYQYYKNICLATKYTHVLDKNERPFAEKVYEMMMDTEIVEHGDLRATTNDQIALLTAHCFNQVETVAYNAAQNKELTQHPYAAFEFVNSDLFAKFVTEEAKRDFKQLSDGEIRRFIHIFRDLYNTRIDDVIKQVQGRL